MSRGRIDRDYRKLITYFYNICNIKKRKILVANDAMQNTVRAAYFSSHRAIVLDK